MNDIQIIPQPTRLTTAAGAFNLRNLRTIVAPADLRPSAEFLSGWLKSLAGLAVPVSTPDRAADENAVVLSLDPSRRQLGPEGYALQMRPGRIVVSAPAAAGVFYGCQTLRQLIFAASRPAQQGGGDMAIPCLDIEDSPRFAWRGAHLDSSRHFFSLDTVKRFVDLLALHKLNRFHWHLTDDQGWRVEIRRYPKLTEVGAWRKETMIGHGLDKPPRFDGVRHGGFHTQAEIRELVAYAAERHITVVPEIDMPGHMQAAIASYPQLGNTGRQLEVLTGWGISADILNVEQSTVSFMQDVLGEVIDLFPGPWLHIGGDEAMKDQWKNSPRAQARKQEIGLADEDQLQSWFIGQMSGFITSRGRKMIGWDEILEGGLAAAIVMGWRGLKGGVAAAQAGHDVVMAPTEWTYFDFYHTANRDGEPLAIGGCTGVRKVYEYDPIPPELTAAQAAHILGSQGQLWSEYIPTQDVLDQRAYPRLCALAEVVWSPKERRDWPGFRTRLENHKRHLDALGVRYFTGPLE